MTKVLIVGLLMLGFLIEMVLRYTVLLVLTCTIFGLFFLLMEDQLDTVVRPMLLPSLKSYLEAP